MEEARDSDHELDAVVQGVHALLPPADSDDELNTLTELVRNTSPKEKYKRRGELLTAHMRAVKKAKGSTAAGSGPAAVAKHVLERIDRMNADYAVRAEDSIDVGAACPQRTSGRGAWKRWLPQAILRACWGLRPRRRARQVRLRVRTKTKPPPLP